jgi:hypothetical protein
MRSFPKATRRPCSPARMLIAGLGTLLLAVPASRAQRYGEPGKPVGDVTVRDNLIVLTLNEGALGPVNLFDLAHHTVRFVPDGTRYRIESAAEQWDPDFGPEYTGPKATLTKMTFPFSGKSWTEFSVGTTGTITFGATPAGGQASRGAPSIGRDGGLAIERFAELQQAGRQLVNTTPAIAAFFKPRLSGKRFVKELPDCAVITWSLSEPYGNIQDWSWTPTVNKIQAVLHKTGEIDLTWDDVNAKDAIVGVYPMVSGGAEKELATVPGEENPSISANLDLKRVRLAAVDGLYLKTTFETRGPVLPETDSNIAGAGYRVCVMQTKPIGDCNTNQPGATVWTVIGGRDRRGDGEGRGTQRPPRYMALGVGVAPEVKIEGNSLSLRGVLPPGLKPGSHVWISASTMNDGQPADSLPAHEVTLTGIGSPELHLSSLKKTDGPFPVAFESFHYGESPRAVDLTCSVIKALGDNYDMLAYYSDFRIDNPEAGTSSNGPLGGGPDGGKVEGIAAPQRGLQNYCTQGRFQWQFIQPVAVTANQMQEYPPDGLDIPGSRDIISYTHQLAERTFNGKVPPYDYAISQIGHEMGHRWSAFVSAKVNDETIVLGPTHWATGLQAPVAFPYQRPTEASAMGGGVWQDNYDGTFTQLDDDYYVPATGWSYLDLYLMGMIAPIEVPDFFILRNLQRVGVDPNGHGIYKGDRTKVTINDVIAAEGPRTPDVDHAQKHFNIGMVLVVEHGQEPSQKLIDVVNGIAPRWVDYWETTTGHRSTMTTNPR